ncbi:hypothetical protein [Candidatus Uabimicrobium amorphum]|uniref:Uncharacterized protein n=1 Tax=Uabimicrobium amorphum TaxID=2596890 RepID=A0A5S9IV36_UABAM|nr:hypothetical protein [Candidatus Uabimicrobium amorphum]BBM87135.1 hypothetical protein UABAM_05538 [Candidatus Uabimicrobium amorphum]
MKSSRVLKVFIKLWIMVTAIFVVLDLVTSIIGIYTLISNKTPLIFRIIISFVLALSAIIANGIGKIFSVVTKEGYSVRVYSEKNGFQDVIVTSKLVYVLVGQLPLFLSAFDWLTSFLGTCILFSKHSVTNIDEVYSIFLWFMLQFNENVVVAIIITIITIFSSCSPYLLLRLSEIDEYIDYTSAARRNDGPSEDSESEGL